MSKCTNNTGFSFSLSNGTSLGWDSNGTPCSISANKPNTTSIGSYYPNVNSGYYSTKSSGITGRGTSGSSFYQPLPSYVPVTNPYLNGTSSFPTFTPPVINVPPQNNPVSSIVSTYSTVPDSVKSIISQNAINREIQKDNQIKQLVSEFKGKYPNASENSLRDIADYVAYGDNHYNDLMYFAQGHLLGDSGEVFGLPIMGNATSIKEYREVKKSLENAGYYFEYVHNSSVQGGKGYWVKVGIADRIFKNTSKDNYYTPLKKVAQSCLLGDQSSGGLWGLPITCDPTTIQKYIDAKIALESEGYQFEYIHYSTLVPGSKGYWVKVNSGTSTSTPKAYWRDQDIFNIVTMEKIALMKNSVIIEFSLANYKLGDKYISHVSNILKSNICANLKVLDLKNNNLTDTSVMSISNNITTGKVPSLKVLNLADNNITDTGAGYLAESLKSPSNKLNIIHVEGNRLTSTGEWSLVKELLNKATKHMIVYTQRLEQNSKLLPGVGTKDEKIAIYKEYIKKGIEKGTYDKGIVVDKSLWGEFKNSINIVSASFKGVGGFIKCNWQPEDVITGYAQDKLVAKISKSLSKSWGIIEETNSIISCYLEATDDMWTTNPGIDAVKHDLCVMGETEFCGN